MKADKVTLKPYNRPTITTQKFTGFDQAGIAIMKKCLNKEYKGDCAEFKPVLANITQAALLGNLDGNDLLKMIDDGGNLFIDLVVTSALKGNPDIFTSEIVDNVGRQFAEQKWKAKRYAYAIVEHCPTALTAYALKLMLATTLSVSEMEQLAGPMAIMENFGAEGILFYLLKEPKHYARLLSQIEVDDRMVKWLCQEEYEQNMKEYELEVHELAELRRLEEEDKKILLIEKAAATKGELIVKRQGVVTPVITGIHYVDEFWNSPSMRASRLRRMEEDMKDLLPPQRNNYFPLNLLSELGLLLSTEHKPGALRLLKQIAKYDLNCILHAAEEIGPGIGEVLDLKEKEHIDFVLIKQNKERYGFSNLFTAWAIGQRDLSPQAIEQLGKLEVLLQEEAPATVYRAVNALLDKDSGWELTTIERLCRSQLFDNCRWAHVGNIDKILAVKREEQPKLFLLFEHPGRLRKLFGWPITGPRFEEIMEKLEKIFLNSEATIRANLKMLESFPFVLNNEQWADVLASPSQEEARAGLETAIDKLKFEHGLSHGLIARIDKLPTRSREVCFECLSGELEKADSPESKIAAAAKFLGISLLDLDEDKIHKAFKGKARQLHSDLHRDDPLADVKFGLAKETANILLQILREFKTGQPTVDPEQNLLEHFGES